MKIYQAICLSIVILSNPVLALSLDDDEKLNGSQILWACSQKEKDWIGYCNGYLTAVRDIMQREFGPIGKKRFCVPKGSDANDLFEAYWQYRKTLNSADMNEMDDMDAFLQVSVAYSLFFKCD